LLNTSGALVTHQTTVKPARCLAEVWINRTENRNSILDQGDIEEGLAAAGDHRIMEQAGRTVRYEAFTHGSSVELIQWFKQGVKAG
jgi:predicted metalloprotease